MASPARGTIPLYGKLKIQPSRLRLSAIFIANHTGLLNLRHMLHFLAMRQTFVHLPDFKLLEGRRETETVHSIGATPQILSRKIAPDIARFTLPAGFESKTPQLLVREDGTTWRIKFVPGYGWTLDPPSEFDDPEHTALLAEMVAEVRKSGGR